MKSIFIISILLCNCIYAQEALNITQWGKDREISGKQDFYAFNYLKVKSIEESTYFSATDSSKFIQEPTLVLEFDTLGRLRTKIYNFHKESKFRGPFTTIPDTSDGTSGKYLFKSIDTSITYITSRLVYSYPEENTVVTEDLVPKIYPTTGVLDGIYIRSDSLRKETVLTKTDSRGRIQELTYFVNDKEVRKERYVYQSFSNKGNTNKLLIRIECIEGNSNFYEIRFKYEFSN
ncbi:hypothetical protein [Crocinitomix catalasitica]|uniref:hypothetical protein n=1 Tax=Crocinitomix catalasitica TaxID=184607 RepID=UPI0004830918|nr:hypothetical protein [Crocinitomix catalasitica]